MDKKVIQTTGGRLKDLRENRGLTQQKAADALGVSLSLYGRYERDVVLPSTLSLIAAADFYSVSIDFLLCRVDFTTGTIGRDIAQVTGLSDDAIKTLNHYHKAAGLEKIVRENLAGDTAPSAAYSLLANTVSFLLRPEHTVPNGSGLLHLIGQYIIADDMTLSEDLPPELHTPDHNGSGITFDTLELIRSALPNMILARLNEYRAERLKNRRKHKKQDAR